MAKAIARRPCCWWVCGMWPSKYGRQLGGITKLWTQWQLGLMNPQIMAYLDIKFWILLFACYHKDRCTKNKRMFRIPMLCLFLTWTENCFFFCAGVFLLLIKEEEKKPTYLGRQFFFHNGKFPIHSGPLLKANCAPCIFFSTPRELPSRRAYILHTTTALTSPILLAVTPALIIRRR
jgi:hypothetical protein